MYRHRSPISPWRQTPQCWAGEQSARGGLWSQIERRSHIKYLELLAAWFGVRAFAKDRKNIHIHLRMDNRTAVFYVNQMGGDSFPSVEQPSNSVMAVVFREEPVHYSRISSRGRQLCSRQRVQSNPINCRVTITPTHFPADPKMPLQLQHRSVRNSTQYPAEAVCELETRPRLCGGRCSTATLEQVEGLYLPSFLPNWQMYQEGQRRQSISDTGTVGPQISESQLSEPSIIRTVVVTVLLEYFVNRCMFY